MPERLMALTFLLLASSWPVSASAEGSPWLPVPKTGSVSLSYISQEADKFYIGSDRRTPGFREIEQTTLWLDANFGLSDALALDLQIGRSESEAKLSLKDQDGRTDLSVGLTWRLVDEDISEAGLPSVALRVGAILAGDYDVGVPNAIGDDADGFEVSAIAGKIFAERFALSGEIGRRSRNDGVPSETFFNAAAHYQIASRLSLSARYQRIDSSGSLDIMGPGFNPTRFPEVTEDIERVSLGVSYRLTDQLSLAVNWFDTIDGRNTSDFEALAATLTYHFDLYRP